MKHEIPEQ